MRTIRKRSIKIHNHDSQSIHHQTNGFFTDPLQGRSLSLQTSPSRVRRSTLSVGLTSLVTASILLFCVVKSVSAGPLIGTAPPLGTAASFAVLGASTVTNTGPTIVTGNLGVSPGTAVTGFPPGQVIGAIHAADAVALQAQSDVTTAYNNLASQPCAADFTGQNLGGMTLIPGVYCYASSTFLTGILTLNGQGNPNAVFIFKSGSTLITAPNSSVVMINNVNACNVFWQVGSSATLDVNTGFIGNILALTSISLNSGARLVGRALARNGAVTMDSNVVDASCAVAATPTATATNTPTPVTPVATIVIPPVGPGTPVPTAVIPPVGPGTPVPTAIIPPVGPGTPVPTAVIPPVGPGTPVATETPTPEATRRNPSVITLKSFTAVTTTGVTWVRWETGQEIDTFGFVIYRSEIPDLTDALLMTQDIITSKGINGYGASYAYRDTTVVSDHLYYYWLKEVEITGRVTSYGPAATLDVALPAAVGFKLFMPVLLQS